MNLIHTSKTYTWVPELNRYIPNAGVTFEREHTSRKIAKQWEITNKAYKKQFKKLKRSTRLMREARG